MNRLLKRLYRVNLEAVFKKLGLHQKLKHLSREDTDTVQFDERINENMPRSNELPIRYIHIGYPKAASTALQKGFFGASEVLLHLGCGNRTKKDYWDDHGYIDSDVNIALEIDLRFRNELSYNADSIRSVFDQYFDKAKQDRNIHGVGISNENLCFNWQEGIDTTTKARRLYEIFGTGTKIVMVIRRQTELIESLYKETVRFGYKGNFEQYMQYLWQFRDRNFLYDFCFDLVYELYSDLFGKENVGVFFFEELKESQTIFLQRIADFIGVALKVSAIDKVYNKQLTDEALSIKRDLNNLVPHTFERGHLHPFGTHRFVSYYTEILKEPKLDADVIFDYELRNDLNRLAEKLSHRIDTLPIEISWDGKYAKSIREFYRTSNNRFISLLGNGFLKKHNYSSL